MANNINETHRCLMSRYNFFEKLFFWWLKDVVCYVKRPDFDTSKFNYTLKKNLSEAVTNKLERTWEEEMNDAFALKRKPNLWNAITKTYRWDFLQFAVFSACNCIIIVLQPQLLKLIMTYFDVDSKMSTSFAYITATVFVTLMLLHVIFDCHGEFQLTLIGARAKIACSSLIYRKMLRLSPLSNHCVGTTVINLLSMDVAKFECLFYCIPYIVMLPLQAAATFYLMWQSVGFGPAAVGIVFVIIQTLPMKVMYYKIFSNLQAKQTERTDKRISLISEVVDGIRAVKFNVWESYFEKLVYSARRLEIGNFLKISYLTSAMWVIATFSHRLCSFVVGVLYTLQYGPITAVQILPINLHFFNLRSNFIYFFFGARSFIEMHASIKRIQEFLLLEEKRSINREAFVNEQFDDVISIKNVTASWDDKSDEKTLENINIDFFSKKLYAIVGLCGSGKTSLLKAILGELRPLYGEVIVHGKISYTSQMPWLFASSIRDNILFGEIHDEDKYDRIINACTLLDDFSQLPYGDKTLVGERNITFTESLRAKINIARAVYRDSDIYLFDDPLSIVDDGVDKGIIYNCINVLLKDKTRIFVTRSMQNLCNADEIILVDHGKVKFKGCLTDFQKNEEYLELLADDSSIAEHNEPSVNETETIIEDSEVDDGENVVTCHESENNLHVEPKEKDHFIVKQTKDHSFYQKYFEVGGSFLLTVLIAFNVMFILSVSTFDFQLAAWGQHENTVSKTVNQTHYPVEISYSSYAEDRFWILGSLIVFIVISATCKNIFLYKFMFNASQTIHDTVFACLIRTPLQFFEVNPSERIVNLFSKITDSMDSALSQSLFESIQTSGHAIAILIPIYIVDWRYVFPTILSIYFYVKISKIYISCIQKLKKLVAKAKHLVLSSVLSSLDGLTTIHSFRAEKTLRKNFDTLQDRHTIVHFLAVALVQGFSFWMYLITIGLFAVVLYGSIALKNHGTTGGHVGLALMQLLSVGFLMASVVGYIVETMSSMASVRRLLGLMYMENETSPCARVNSDRVSESWPDKGEIEFRQLHLKCPIDNELVLKNFNFVIKEGTKVNVIGSTGENKSSIVAAFFRLAHFDGHLFIDGVDIKKVSLAVLRSKISIIPKEPILFTSTLRKNLDPLSEFDDESLWSALDDVELKHKFRSLGCPLNQEGSNLNRSLRYLLCFARAILKRNKILILDEVMDNVDLTVQALIRDIIGKKFQECTVLMIARKLNVSSATEKVLIMQNGEVVDYDYLYELQRNNKNDNSL